MKCGAGILTLNALEDYLMSESNLCCNGVFEGRILATMKRALLLNHQHQPATGGPEKYEMHKSSSL